MLETILWGGFIATLVVGLIGCIMLLVMSGYWFMQVVRENRENRKARMRR